MKRMKEKIVFSYISPVVVIILYIKSIIVLFSLYEKRPIILFFGLISIVPILLFLSFSFVLSSRKKMFYIFFWDVFISLLFFIDIVYVRAYGHLISFYMIIAKNVTNDLGPSIFSLISWKDFLIFADIPLLLILILKAKNSEVNRKTKLFLITFILTLSVISYQFVLIEKNAYLGNYRLNPLQMSPIGYHIFDFYRFIYEKGYSLDKLEIEIIDDWLDYNVRYHIPDKKYASLEGLIKGKNIIAIQFESLENIMINKSYYGEEITPNINKLLDSSIYFTNIVEQVRDGNSSDAELLFNASLYPLNRGSTFLRFGENKFLTLPKLLSKEGYISIAIHGDDKEFWNRNRVFPSLGFNKYIDEVKFDNKTSIGMGIIDQSLFKQSIIELKKLQEPYNALIITLTSHMPFNLNDNMKYLNLPNQSISDDYLQSIHYTDKFFGEFYNELKFEGLLDNSVLIIYGDHEGIHKYYKTSLPNNKYRIPFIIHIPGINGFEVNKIGGQVDIFPTLAYLLDLDRREYEAVIMGRNIFGKYSGSGILSTGEIVGKPDDIEHLKKSSIIADMYISGNYLKIKTE